MTACTDDERRRVAERLRELRVERYNSILNGIHLGEIVGVGAQIVSPHEDQVRAAADRLADLIDPDCEEGRYSVARTVRPVDRDALLELADILGSTRETDCSGCRLEGAGCAECSSGVAHEAARRIREALGVTADADA